MQDCFFFLHSILFLVSSSHQLTCGNGNRRFWGKGWRRISHDYFIPIHSILHSDLESSFDDNTSRQSSREYWGGRLPFLLGINRRHPRSVNQGLPSRRLLVHRARWIVLARANKNNNERRPITLAGWLVVDKVNWLVAWATVNSSTSYYHYNRKHTQHFVSILSYKGCLYVRIEW